jgi:protein involved in sex pheromone biosynthesis
VEFGSMVTSADVTGSDDDDDDYPILFMTRDSNANARKTDNSAKPKFDESVDSLFGKYSDNVGRNVDDGYGESFSSSGRRRDRRSDRSRRNR